jgi:hypothetical protein
MNFRRTLVAAALAAVAFPASALEAMVIVTDTQACPAGTVTRGPAYRWENGQLVRAGWVCGGLLGKS